MEVYEALPDGDAKGAVIVIQEAFGVNEHIRDVTRRMAAEGRRRFADRFSIRTMVDDTERLYRELLTSRPHR